MPTKKKPIADRRPKPSRVQIRLINPDAVDWQPKSIHHTVFDTNIAEVEEEMRKAKILPPLE